MYQESVSAQAEAESSPALNSGFGEATQTHLADLRDLLAVQQMDERGARFVPWQLRTIDGEERKVPLRLDGRPARTNEAVTWATLEHALEAVPRLHADGVGFILAAERDEAAGLPPIVGVDLDGCRSPEKGELDPWAREIIREFGTYAEISPSGTGVKLFCLLDHVPTLPGNVLTIEKTDGRAHNKQIEIYTTGRYFAVTGRHLEDTPDELVNATEAFERLASRMTRSGSKSEAVRGEFTDTREEPSSEAWRVVGNVPFIAKLWRGEKEKGDTSGSGKDWQLAQDLGRQGLSNDDIARLLTRYQHGQIGSGKLQGGAADRRLAQLVGAGQAARQEREAERALAAENASRIVDSFSRKDQGQGGVREHQERLPDPGGYEDAGGVEPSPTGPPGGTSALPGLGFIWASQIEIDLTRNDVGAKLECHP
jgi:hypothetical protein